MNMNKLILALALVVGFGGVSFADNDTILAPKDSKGVSVHPLYGGYKATRLDSTTETLICSGRCILGGLYMSSGAVASQIMIRDSATADSTTSLATKILMVGFVQTNTAAHGNKVPAPIRTSNGIVAKLNSVSLNEEVSILYIDGDE